jgi:uncharacterized metal-binding protein YceD (DUF177 family)
MTPEFSRPERLDTIGTASREVTIDATSDERAALAARFGLIAIDRLTATLDIKREAGGIVVRGQVRASVTQACVVTDDPVPTEIDEPLALRFVDDTPAAEEVELAADDLDTVPIEGGAIDLGEAAAETMALALDPYPRAPEAAATLRAAGVITEDEAKPSGKLAGLGALLKGESSG